MSSHRRKTKNKRKCDALVHRYLLLLRSTRRSYLLSWAKETQLEDVDDDSRNKAK